MVSAGRQTRNDPEHKERQLVQTGIKTQDCTTYCRAVSAVFFWSYWKLPIGVKVSDCQSVDWQCV